MEEEEEIIKELREKKRAGYPMTIEEERDLSETKEYKEDAENW
jgi:hypothetical protein